MYHLELVGVRVRSDAGPGWRGVCGGGANVGEGQSCFNVLWDWAASLQERVENSHRRPGLPLSCRDVGVEGHSLVQDHPQEASLFLPWERYLFDVQAVLLRQGGVALREKDCLRLLRVDFDAPAVEELKESVQSRLEAPLQCGEVSVTAERRGVVRVLRE